MRFARMDFESAGLSAPALLFFACPKKRRQKKGHPTAWSPLRSDFPALLAVSGARELPPFGRSDMHALVSGNGCDARLHQGGRGAPLPATGTPVPLTPPSIAGPDREKRGLSERSESASSAAPVWTEKRRKPLASARGKSSGAVSFGYFSLGKQRKVPRVRAAARFQKLIRALARTTTTDPNDQQTTVKAQMATSAADSKTC